MTLFDRIKNLSVKNGKSLQQVADELGFSSNLFYRWQKSEPKAKDVAKVADYFHVSTDYLLGRDNPNQKPVDLADMDALVTYQGKDIPEQDRELINDLLKRLQG